MASTFSDSYTLRFAYDFDNSLGSFWSDGIYYSASYLSVYQPKLGSSGDSLADPFAVQANIAPVAWVYLQYLPY